jgi:uncharacterized protein (TIGR02145 family)
MKRINKFLTLILMFVMFISFGVDKSFSQVTDKDGNVYKTVKIGTQEWMSENLKVEHYRNGDAIRQVQDSAEWSKLTTGAWCYYKNTPTNGKAYGKLYNWYAVSDPRGLAPEGWHVATDEEWKAIVNLFGGEDFAGGKLKAKTGWDTPNNEATNESGFNATPGGQCDNLGNFFDVGKFNYIWNATTYKEELAWHYYIMNNSGGVGHGTQNYKFGMSVRCVKD